MERDEICEEFKGWLERKEIKFHLEGAHCFRLLMSGDNGLFQIRAEFEDAPMMLQATCAIPVRVPAEKVNETSLILHEINYGLRIGAFQFYRDCNVTAFRMGLPIRQEVELSQQFSQVIYTTLATVDDNVCPFVLLFCSTARVKGQLAQLKPKPKKQPAKIKLINQPRGRLELN